MLRPASACSPLLREGVHTLRASLGRRLVSRCPFCRKAAKPRKSAPKRMIAAACPSHALIMETDGGPPSVVAHLPCAEGRYCSRASRVLLLSIAQERLVDAFHLRLDKEREATARLSRQLECVKSRARRRCLA